MEGQFSSLVQSWWNVYIVENLFCVNNGVLMQAANLNFKRAV